MLKTKNTKKGTNKSRRQELETDRQKERMNEKKKSEINPVDVQLYLFQAEGDMQVTLSNRLGPGTGRNRVHVHPPVKSMAGYFLCTERVA